MIKDQCISVTDLRTKTKNCLSGLEKKPKYIFVNNKPVAVLLDVDEFESLNFKPQLIELNESEVSVELKKKAEAAKNLKNDDLINI